MRSVILGLLAVCLSGVAHADGKDVFGIWLTEAGSAKLNISDCGDGTPCGRVIWMDPDALRPGLTPETATDENNPDPEQQAQPVLGLLMLSDFNERSRDWRGGDIYDPESGKTYGARLKRLDNGTLQVKGCIGPICQTQIWTASELDAAPAG
ncbi:MAG: DUF2147 domain-containing protein [Pseudomonadota bacterium]